ncbi:hypothetical protein LIER_14692 [Lithospermum erythrorhizon]|uniref:RING-type E3 ubiquitin transferase n=1 Tax=Lithospermum erythrorhizon TaxID=34254 RepID=A0AAV3Q5B1_LITER
MAFHHRKLLPGKLDVVGVTVSVGSKPCIRICITPCPDDCNAMSPPPPPPPQASSPHAVFSTSAILIIVLCLLFFAFLVVSYLSIIRYRCVRNTRRRNLHGFNDSREDFIDENHGPVVDHPIWYIRTVGLQQSVIDEIDVFVFKKGEGLVEGSDCSVCLSEFDEDENLRLLPKCSHAFHIHCIDTWLRSHTNCPLCRAPVVNDVSVGRVAVEESNSDSSGSEEGNQVENVSNLAVVGSDEEGGDERREMIVNYVEDCTSFRIDGDNGVDEISDKNLSFGPARENKVRRKSDMAEHRRALDVEIMEPVRRSISMDCGSASLIYINAENNGSLKDEGSSSTKEDEGAFNCHTEEEMKQSSEIVPRSGNRNSSIYNLMKSSSLGRSLQKVPSSMRRSFSSGGKNSLPTHREDSN